MELARDAKIFVAGHRGLVGSAIWRHLKERGFTRLIGRTRAELDLIDSAAVKSFFAAERPDYVIIAAAKVGGIMANSTYPVEFLKDNLLIQTHVMDAAHANGIDRLLFLGSSCIYPRMAPQPISEESLLTGPLEPTNEWYAVAKIAGIKLVQAYRRQHGRAGRRAEVRPARGHGGGCISASSASGQQYGCERCARDRFMHRHC